MWPLQRGGQDWMIEKYQSLVPQFLRQGKAALAEKQLSRFKIAFRWALAGSFALSAILISIQPLNLRFSLPIQEIHVAWNLTRILIEF